MRKRLIGYEFLKDRLGTSAFTLERPARVSSVTKVTIMPDALAVGALNCDGIEHGLQLRDVMTVGSGHDERQRDATSVHQQMAFAPIFFPDPWDSLQRFAVPVALSSSPRQCFAIARRCLQTRRIRQALISTGLQRRRPSPTRESGHELHWRCRNARQAAPSTGSLFSGHTRCLRIRDAGPWACVRPPAPRL